MFRKPMTTGAGLEEALKLEWSSTARVLYLLSQTPQHGWRFQQDFEVSGHEFEQTCGQILDDCLEVLEVGAIVSYKISGCQVCIRILLHFHHLIICRRCFLLQWRDERATLAYVEPHLLKRFGGPFETLGLVGTSWALHRNLHIGSGAANSATGWLRCLLELALSRPLLDFDLVAAHGPVQAISVPCAWPRAGLTAFCATGPVQASLRGSQVLCRPGGTWTLALSRPLCSELSWPCAGPWCTF